MLVDGAFVLIMGENVEVEDIRRRAIAGGEDINCLAGITTTGELSAVVSSRVAVTNLSILNASQPLSASPSMSASLSTSPSISPSLSLYMFLSLSLSLTPSVSISMSLYVSMSMYASMSVSMSTSTSLL